MIDIPAQEIILRITEQKGMAENEVRQRIDEKLQQLAGLISEDGAAHIIANELGVELVKQAGEAKIRDLFPGMRSITAPGRVTRKYEIREFEKGDRKGKVASFMLGDETGQMRVTLWNEQTDLFSKFEEGDVVRVRNGFVKENRGFPEIHLNADSSVEIRPEGVTVEVKGLSRPERKTIKELQGNEENVELLGTIIQVYDPRFFDVCPQCNRRVMEQGGVPTCGQHGKVEPTTNYVVSAFLDDGTGNIRTTFWKQQSQRLLEKGDEELLRYKDDGGAFEAEKTALLGEIVKIVGRCKRNETFDRIELTANLVFRNVDPEEELARLAAEQDSGQSSKSAGQKVSTVDSSANTAVSSALEKKETQTSDQSSTAPVPENKEMPARNVQTDKTPSPSDDVRNEAKEEVINLDDLDELE